MRVDDMWFQPRILANLWHTFSGNDATIFDSTRSLLTPFGQTTVEVGGGGAMLFPSGFGAYAQFTYTADVSGNEVHAVKGIVGVRYNW
jgi:outer membrane autotransporter protein